MTVPASLAARVSSYASCLALGYAALLVSSMLVCLPILAVLSELGVGSLPGGDRALFEPGALLLLEVVRVGRARLATGLGSSALSALLTSLLTLPVAAAVMVRLQRPEHTAWAFWLARTVRAVPTFLMLGGITMLCRAGIVVLLGLLAARTHDVMLVAVGPEAADLVLLAAALAAAALLGLLGALQDLARAVAITHQADGYRALQHGLRLARRHALRWLLPWSVAAGGTFAAVLVVATAGAIFDLSRAGAWRPAAQFLVCQTAVATALMSRIWWFDRALQLARRRASFD